MSYEATTILYDRSDPTGIIDAAQDVLANLQDAMLDNAERFSCNEIEHYADLYRAFGLDNQAIQLIDTHAAGDDEGDDHYDPNLHDTDAD